MAQCLPTIIVNSLGKSFFEENITATAGDILSGKVIIGKDGEPLVGTMTNRGIWNSSVGINGSITIPAGYHNGSGKVTNSTATMGGQTITPRSTSQTVSCSGRYMTGNIVVNGARRWKTLTISLTKTGNRFSPPGWNEGGGAGAGLPYEYVGTYSGITPVLLVWEVNMSSGTMAVVQQGTTWWISTNSTSFWSGVWSNTGSIANGKVTTYATRNISDSYTQTATLYGYY